MPALIAADEDGRDDACVAFKAQPDGACRAVVAKADEDAASESGGRLDAKLMRSFAEPGEPGRIALTEISDVQRHDRAAMERFGRSTESWY
jgi:hypothetical protein